MECSPPLRYSSQGMDFVSLLLLIIIANSAPVLTTRLLGNRATRAVDGGYCLADGRRLFGPSKTWRGIAAALLLTPLLTMLLGHSAADGLLIAALAMVGDLGSSFCKRRLGLRASAQALGLDQIPESLLPAAVVGADFGLDAGDIAGLVAAFVLLELLLSRIGYRLRLRKEPY